MAKVTGLLSVVLVIVIVEALSNFLLCFHRFSLSSLSLAISLGGDSCHLSVGVVNNGVNFFKDILLEAIGNQVWTLTQFFLFLFCERALICLEGKSMTPHRGNTILFCSSQQLPPRQGLFELTRRPSRTLDLLFALVPELQRYKDAARCP